MTGEEFRAIRDAALRLLRAMNDLGAKDRTDTTVILDNQMIARADLERDSDLFNVALGALLDEGALEQDNETNELLMGGSRPVVGISDYGAAFKITPYGLALLRQTH